MNESGLNKLYWGFLFIIFGFRIQGFDILPDIIGYLFFAVGFSKLATSSPYFSKAAKYNDPMIVLSVFSIYQPTTQSAGIHLGPLGIFSIPIMIASFVLNLLVVYNLFLGVMDMAEKRERFDLAKESQEKWNQYKMMMIAVLFSFIFVFIPFLSVAYIVVIFVIWIILAINILGFLKRCIEGLYTLE